MDDAPVKIVAVYHHSGYGRHAARIAEAVARGAAAIGGASVELVTARKRPANGAPSMTRTR
jgi:trans-2-enoyl-CoA reductase